MDVGEQAGDGEALGEGNAQGQETSEAREEKEKEVMLSVVIPSHNDLYLHKTVASLFDNAIGEIEIVVVLDGYEPKMPIDSRARVIRHGRNRGMREAINTGVAASKGEYIMRLDEHCMVAPGFDIILVDTYK